MSCSAAAASVDEMTMRFLHSCSAAQSSESKILCQAELSVVRRVAALAWKAGLNTRRLGIGACLAMFRYPGAIGRLSRDVPMSGKGHLWIGLGFALSAALVLGIVAIMQVGHDRAKSDA